MLELREVSVVSSRGATESRLLDAVTAQFAPGQLHAVVGPSGCGKSTLLKAIAGVHQPNEGGVFWAGRDLDRHDLAPNEIGYVPQFGIAYDLLTVAESIETALSLRVGGLSAEEREERTTHFLTEVGLAEIADRRVGLLSGGQKRRLALALEMVSEPHFLLCDEVTSGLDPKSESEIVHLLHHLSKIEQRTVISVTHSLRHLELHDTVTVLYEGRLVCQATPASLGEYFGIDNPELLFPTLSTRPAEEWQELWKARAGHYAPRETVPPNEISETPTEDRTPDFFAQFLILLRRRWLLFLRNRGQVARDLAMQPYTTRLAEILATIKANQAKKEISILEAKIEFQALFVQLFLQRRFQHVLIGTRFYREIFRSGESKLEVGKDTKDLFAKSSGLPPTVGTLDALAHEAIRDVNQSIQAFRFLLQKDELQSASKRLAEAFSVGEFMPEVRTLPREEKRQVLEFSQKNYQLISAIEVKDYQLAEKLVKELDKIAKDFDDSKPLAAIETARTVSAMHLAKARNAAVSGDRATLETELKAATEIWPRNPALADVSGLIFSQADVQQKALVDLDQLISQHNNRQIYNDKLRFIAAAALYPDRQEQLKKILDQMQVVETAIIQAGEIEKHGDYAGAWETIEKVYKDNPDDSKLNQMRANLTTEAAEFVRTLRTAEQLEAKDEIGSSLAWYLKAQKLYPASEFAQGGIDRLVKKVLPEK